MKTNRDYFSWSQYTLFKSSKFQFYKRYVLDEQLHLPAFEKGKEFADFRETGKISQFNDDPLLETVSNIIPNIGTSEFKIEVGFETGLPEVNKLNLLSYIDECSDDLTEFFEFKTGKNAWTQKMVDDHKQLDFYAACIYLLNNGAVIPKCTLYWIETEEIKVLGEKKLMYTSVVESFEKQFTEIDIENILIELAVTYKEIINWEYEEIELEDDIVDRYLEIDNEIKKLSSEKEIIKLKVLDELNSVGSKYGIGTNGKFSISERKSPIYSKELITKEKQYKSEIDKLKKSEKDSPDIKYSITESLLFKARK